MSRRSKVTATYKPCAEETFHVEVTAASCYPDALDEARKAAVRGVTELIAAAIAAYPVDRREDPAETD